MTYFFNTQVTNRNYVQYSKHKIVQNFSQYLLWNSIPVSSCFWQGCKKRWS